jgi:glycosyltransferase involved in cell wall biosynthesis
VRILVISKTFPWPERTGTAIRTLNVLHGLSREGEVDLFTLVNPSRPDPCVVPPGAPLAREGHEWRPAKPAQTIPHRLRWLATGRVPAEFAGRDYQKVVDAFRDFADPPYDLVWFARVESHLVLAPHVDPSTPSIVDVDDLEDYKTESRVDWTGQRHPPLRRAAMKVTNGKNVRLYRALHERIAAASDAVVLCSEVDRRRLGVPNAVVIPNGYAEPTWPVGRPEPGDPPTIVFQGFLLYPPNAEAAEYLVRDVLPLVRGRLPDAGVRLVGSSDERVERLADPPRVEVTGYVPSMEPELARADLVAVPIHYGSGTRIKILEAFAHRIPVVSTTPGAEGLDVEDGRHLLIADTAQAFADACVTLLTDRERRASLVDEAHRHYLERFRWTEIQGRVAELARLVAARQPLPTG